MLKPHKSYCLAPDPLTEPEKCSGIRRSFTIISVFGIALLFFAALALYSPSVYSFLGSTTDIIFSSDAQDPMPLQNGSGPPIFH